jgi:hypothetical protein
MRLKIGSGQLKEWFEKANEEELILMYLMNPRSIHSLCVLLTLEYQMLEEKN